jgi:hypothetical protein
MARKTWKQAVQSDKGYAEWTFGKGVRSLDTKRYETMVSNALKGIYSRYERYTKALAFAKRMRERAMLVRREGCHRAGQPYPSRLGREIVAAMSWGVGDGNNRVMIMRYEACAKAAERFCRR